MRSRSVNLCGQHVNNEEHDGNVFAYYGLQMQEVSGMELRKAFVS